MWQLRLTYVLEIKLWESLQISKRFFDLRFLPLFLNLSENFQIFPITDRIYLGLPGLATDVTTLLVGPLFNKSEPNSFHELDANDFDFESTCTQ